jgi:hypothetical protein
MAGERGRWLLLATAVAQAAAPSAVGFDQDAGGDPVVVPPGPFFGHRVTRVLLGTTLGVYAGWATAAIWLNAVTVAGDLGPDLSGASGTFVMAACVAGASVSACLGTRLLGAQPPYVLATAWALLGVLLSTSTERQLPLAAIAGLGLLAVAAVAINTRRRARQVAETA